MAEVTARLALGTDTTTAVAHIRMAQVDPTTVEATILTDMAMDRTMVAGVQAPRRAAVAMHLPTARTTAMSTTAVETTTTGILRTTGQDAGKR